MWLLVITASGPVELQQLQIWTFPQIVSLKFMASLTQLRMGVFMITSTRGSLCRWIWGYSSVIFTSNIMGTPVPVLLLQWIHCYCIINDKSNGDLEKVKKRSQVRLPRKYFFGVPQQESNLCPSRIPPGLGPAFNSHWTTQKTYFLSNST